LQVQRSLDVSQNSITSKRNVILFKKFKSLLEHNFARALTPNHYAEKLNITPHHLNRTVKEITGKTATEVIRARSILEAKRFLTFTDSTVTEIAATLNYFDSSYFSKIFKAETGKSPLAFKSAMSGKYRRK
jgi:AraC-like DNA-binding protein